jgi:carbon monoxide dehydrogenase subunit G
VHFSERIISPVPIATAWDFVWDPARMARCLPGCVGVEELEAGTKYRALIEDKIGPYKVRVSLDVSVLEARPHELIRLLATGEDRSLGVSQRIDLTVRLEERSPTQTALDMDAEVEVTGALVALGGFLVKRKAADIVRQLARNVDAGLRAAA